MDAAMTPKQKIEAICQQIIQTRCGLRTFIVCPYCGAENTPVDKYLCCALFGEATGAILDRIEKQEAIDFISSIQEAASRPAS